MQERVLYFQIEMQKSQLNSDTMPHCQCADAPHPDAAAAPWTRCRAADVPQPAVAAAPVITLVVFLHVCLCSGATTSPRKIYNGTGELSRSPLCPNLAAATTTMLTRTTLSSSARFATCNSAAISATAMTTTTTSSHSSKAWKGLGIPNLLMFQVGTF